jgi:hypothetical protein
MKRVILLLVAVLALLGAVVPLQAQDPGEPPTLGEFQTQGMTVVVGEWADFVTTYHDPDGYQDINRAMVALTRRVKREYVGFVGMYHEASNTLWLEGGGFCVPGQPQLRTAGDVSVDCGNTTVRSEGNTITIKWRVRPDQCFAGGCGLNMAYGIVFDSQEQWNSGIMGTWTLDPVVGAAPATGTVPSFTSADLLRLGLALRRTAARAGVR